MHNKPHSESTKKLLSDLNKGKHLSEYTKIKISNEIRKHYDIIGRKPKRLCKICSNQISTYASHDLCRKCFL